MCSWRDLNEHLIDFSNKLKDNTQVFITNEMHVGYLNAQPTKLARPNNGRAR